MSKISNDGLTRSGTGCFIAVRYPYGNSGCQRVKQMITEQYKSEEKPFLSVGVVVTDSAIGFLHLLVVTERSRLKQLDHAEPVPEFLAQCHRKIPASIHQPTMKH